MTISQKRAIYYSYKAKRDASIDNFLNDNDMMHEFLESGYTSKTWFIKSLIKSYEADRKWINVNNRLIKSIQSWPPSWWPFSIFFLDAQNGIPRRFNALP